MHSSYLFVKNSKCKFGKTKVNEGKQQMHETIGMK